LRDRLEFPLREIAHGLDHFALLRCEVEIHLVVPLGLIGGGV
jgi:hypothetical protein